MVLYLSSQKYGNDNSFLKKWIKEHDNRILLVFNALDAKDKEKIIKNIEEDTNMLTEIGFDVKVIDLKEYFDNTEKLKQDFKKYNNYCIMGGNVFVLRQAMKYSGFDTYLKENLLNEEFLYIGYSAGSCILSNSLKALDIVDDPIKFYGRNEIIYDGLDLIDYVFVPHYKSNYHKVHLVDQVVENCKRKNIKFAALKDGEVIIEKLNNNI